MFKNKIFNTDWEVFILWIVIACWAYSFYFWGFIAHGIKEAVAYSVVYAQIFFGFSSMLVIAYLYFVYVPYHKKKVSKFKKDLFGKRLGGNKKR